MLRVNDFMVNGCCASMLLLSIHSEYHIWFFQWIRRNRFQSMQKMSGVWVVELRQVQKLLGRTSVRLQMHIICNMETRCSQSCSMPKQCCVSAFSFWGLILRPYREMHESCVFPDLADVNAALLNDLSMGSLAWSGSPKLAEKRNGNLTQTRWSSAAEQ